MSFLLRELPNDDLKDDKYVKELQLRIEQGKKQKDSDKEPEPATAIQPEKFFMRMAKLSQKRPGDFQNKAVSNSLIQNHNMYIPYKMIYWQGITIGDWRFYEEIANIKSANFFPQANPQNITPTNKSSCTVYCTR